MLVFWQKHDLVERNRRLSIMKKMSKASFAAALVMTMSFVFSPVYALEGNTKVSTVSYEAKLKDHSSMKEVAGSVFDKNLNKYETEKIKDGVVFTSDNTKIKVNGLNMNKPGEQTVKMTLTTNSALDTLDVPEFYKRFILDHEKPVEKEVTVNVADTTVPTIEMEEKVSTPRGENVDLLKLAKVTDDHKVKSVKVNGDVNYDKDGKYDVQVVATDASGNTATKDVVVRVGNLNQAIADAALAQLGVFQDCTMLVTNSLKAVGINFHGAPEQYLSLGTITNNPVPGDIIVYSGHVAVYIGDGKAVHGGWLGNQTVVSTVECTNAFIGFVHIEL